MGHGKEGRSCHETNKYTEEWRTQTLPPPPGEGAQWQDSVLIQGAVDTTALRLSISDAGGQI